MVVHENEAGSPVKLNGPDSGDVITAETPNTLLPRLGRYDFLFTQSGSVNMAVAPFPGAECISNDPPSARMRSWMLNSPNLEESPRLGEFTAGMTTNPMP